MDTRQTAAADEELMLVMKDKARDIFTLCDKDEKGYINKVDMRRLESELMLSAEQLDSVFDDLDTDKTGRLTLDDFITGFGEVWCLM